MKKGPMVCEISTAGRREISVLAELELRSWNRPYSHEQIEEKLGTAGIHALIAHHGHIIYGYVIFKCGTRHNQQTGKTKNYTAMISLGVDPDWRRRSIGSQLIQATIEFGRSKGHENVICAVDQSDIGSQKFFKSNGFMVLKVLDQFTNGHGAKGCYVFENSPNRLPPLDLRNRIKSNAQD